ncbi:MAG: glycosyltransferase family 1 protein [Candidatus Viridilinea halotolerans]|uniref:Glycosyltransferase family 1 protein n=1 Tax=Candidatus Viridilinea halotolerans TaxID=2491704 RepID=A0A426TSD3_9CHLR|nr:MAG: glycosyltransferase family 1 protein [Candidatus Viridilinea halotolerans]
MHFAFLARLLGPAYAGYGVQTLLLGLLRAIAELDTEHELTLFVGSDQQVPEELRGAFRIAPLAPAPNAAAARLWWDHVAVGMLCRQLGVDALYCPAHVRPLYAPCPTVVLVLDMMYHRFPEQWPWSEQAYMRLAVAWLTSRATRIPALSEATRRDLLALTTTPPERVEVIYPGVPLGFHPMNATAVRMRYDLPQPYILSVGSDHPRKNLIGTLRAFEQVAPAVTHDLVLVGPTVWPNAALEARIAASPCFSRIRRLGLVSEADLIALYSGAELFVFPSLYEGFGFPVLEALACGCPTITSNVSSLSEVAGDAALLIPPGDTAALAATMQRALGDTSLRTELRRRGIERAKSFSWHVAAQQTLELLRCAGQSQQRGTP